MSAGNLPGSTNEPVGNKVYDTPHLQDIEEGIRVYVFSVFTHDGRGRYFRQRSILLTLKPREEIEEQIEELATKIAEKEGEENPEEVYETEVMSVRKYSEIDRGAVRLPDSTVKALVHPLQVAKRSPETGKVFHEEDFHYCPQSSRPLEHVIASGNEKMEQM